ncbi:MAG: PaaI family thioesterase [Candidatus Rokubacteria bacterium]|nr:PaaI family thioesterase [Candidatus Rokubacteria bacterium]
MSLVPPTAGANRISKWFDASPFNKHLGLRLTRLERDRVDVVMPFNPALPTAGDVVHGGAISTLADTAATVCAWAGVEDPPERGATAALTVEFVAAARGCELTATARTLRRGRSLAFVEVDVTEPDGALVAKCLATYKLG